MELGFINFNTEEKQKVYKVLQIVRESQAIDELGIGRIRDVFSNTLFPGMSTLQHHAKYFAVLPSLYYQLTKESFHNVREVRKRIIDLEIKLTRKFVEASKLYKDSDPFGITGSGVLEAAERDSNKYVKYDPTYIYYNGLVTYNIIKSRGNLYNLILEQSHKYNENPSRMKGRTNMDDSADANEFTGEKQLFATCGEVYNFSSSIPLSLDLTYKEAKFIKDHIEESPDSKESLLAYLLKNDIPLNVNGENECLIDYEYLLTIWKDYDIPLKLLHPYILSVRFSKFVDLLRIRYKYLYDSRTEQTDSADEMKELFYDVWQQERADLSNDKIQEIIDYCMNTVHENTVLKFCKEAAILINQESWDELDLLIENREIQVKSRERSKLYNFHRYKNMEFSLQRRLTYRWELVNKVINEIRKGIGYE